ncbi:MAG: hypothetical protein AMXMBFR17_27160 [Candidatus Jettenia caeni]|nr:MAG: hypothetical protein JETCAE04_08540 [Candidatus Jettenia caeni]
MTVKRKHSYENVNQRCYVNSNKRERDPGKSPKILVLHRVGVYRGIFDNRIGYSCQVLLPQNYP